MKKSFFAAITVLAYTMNAQAILIQPIRSNTVADFTLSLQIAKKSQTHKKAWAALKNSHKKSALALKKSPAAPLTLDAEMQKREIAAFERKLKELSQSQAATGSSNNTTSSVQENEQQNIPEAPVVSIEPPAPEVVLNTPIETAPVENIAASQDPLPEPQAPELPPVPEAPVVPEVPEIIASEPNPPVLPEAPVFEPPAFEPPVVEPPVVVNENANEHANNNAQNNSSTESNSQNNSSNGSENSNAGGSANSNAGGASDNADKGKGKK